MTHLTVITDPPQNISPRSSVPHGAVLEPMIYDTFHYLILTLSLHKMKAFLGTFCIIHPHVVYLKFTIDYTVTFNS